MSLYRKLSRKPKLFLSVTGMNLHQFQALLPQFTRAYDKARAAAQTQSRAHWCGSGFVKLVAAHRHANSLSLRLLMLLFYYRLYLTQEFMTLLFSR